MILAHPLTSYTLLSQACRRTQSMLRPPPALTLRGVYRSLHQLALDKGQGAAGRRQQVVEGLIRACRWGQGRGAAVTLAT
jgi:hypothetical protein